MCEISKPISNIFTYAKILVRVKWLIMLISVHLRQNPRPLYEQLSDHRDAAGSEEGTLKNW